MTKADSDLYDGLLDQVERLVMANRRRGLTNPHIDARAWFESFAEGRPQPDREQLFSAIAVLVTEIAYRGPRIRAWLSEDDR